MRTVAKKLRNKFETKIADCALNALTFAHFLPIYWAKRPPKNELKISHLLRFLKYE